MSTQISGFPYWQIAFDQNGAPTDPTQVATLRSELGTEHITDLFVISHGWKNSAAEALSLYTRVMDCVRNVLNSGGVTPAPGKTIGVVGVIWPSLAWPDDSAVPVSAQDTGGVAGFEPRGFGGPAASPPAVDVNLVPDLRQLFPSQDHKAALDELEQLLQKRPSDPVALARVQQIMQQLVTSSAADNAPEDSAERAMLTADPVELFRALAVDAPTDDSASTGGTAGFGDTLGQLWDGVKVGLRQLTYLEMKMRAGTVGRQGLGPLLDQLHADNDDLRIHLAGHSFGARLVSFALSGLSAASDTPGKSPVKSVVLLQGAFSHFAFAEALPWNKQRGGVLAGQARRVDGPLAATFTPHDTAVGLFYSRVQFLLRDDTAGLDSLFFRWGAMGHDGAQAVSAQTAPCGPIGQTYPFQAGKWVNLDSHDVIKNMENVFAGAHGDIAHDEIAWAMLSAAKLVSL
jgi:hypothetical protein